MRISRILKNSPEQLLSKTRASGLTKNSVYNKEGLSRTNDEMAKLIVTRREQAMAIAHQETQSQIAKELAEAEIKSIELRNKIIEESIPLMEKVSVGYSETDYKTA